MRVIYNGGTACFFISVWHVPAYASITHRVLTLITRLLDGVSPKVLAKDSCYAFIRPGDTAHFSTRRAVWVACSSIRMKHVCSFTRLREATFLPQMLEAKSWDNAGELGRSYAKQMRFAYRKNTRAHAADTLFHEHLASIDAIQQVRDSKAYAITDLDYYDEFTGGLAQAARVAGNALPPVYITDTSEVYVETTSTRTMKRSRCSLSRSTGAIGMGVMMKRHILPNSIFKKKRVSNRRDTFLLDSTA